jgi:hypothetical protein
MTSNGSGAALEVQEGYAGQVLAGLTEDQAKVLVFISHGADSETGRKRFKALREIAQMIDLLVADRSQKESHALVEALTPDVELSRNKVVEAEMLANARSIVLESKDYVRSTALADSASYSSKNPSSQPNRWKRNG